MSANPGGMAARVGNARWRALDDTRPAGPYPHVLDERGLRLVCLATIDQAARDARRNQPALSPGARCWLADTARLWLRALGVARGWVNPESARLFSGCDQPGLWADDGETPPGDSVQSK